MQHFDTHAGLRNALSMVADRDSEWAGIPMPLDGQQLIIEPTYPRAEALMKIGPAKPETEQDPETDDLPPGTKIRNRFWSWHRRSDIVIWEEPQKDGTLKIQWGIEPGVHGLPFALETLRCSDAWSIESESRALQTLSGLIRHRQFRQYLLTGAFLETSPRSHVTYMFRKLRPTVAMREKILCALCLHPIAYYSGSWAGAMVPTDDVLAHLMLMRGDEKMLWKRANQHPSWRSAAGLS